MQRSEPPLLWERALHDVGDHGIRREGSLSIVESNDFNRSTCRIYVPLGVF